MQRSCPLCGSEGRPLFEKQGAPYFRCERCGFAYSKPTRNPNLESRLEDYETSYLDYLAGNEDDERNFEATCDWMERLRALEGCRILDVGCGSGNFVRHLRRRGVEAFGVEPSKALFEHFLSGQPWFGHSEIDDVELPAGPRRFEVLTAFDVIEHVPWPGAFRGAAIEALAPDGWLFLSTPDAGSVGARVFGRRWHYYNKYHLSFLSRSTLTAAGEKVGLELVDFSRRGRLQSAGYMARYFLEFILGRKGARVPRMLDRIRVPINLGDVMYVALRKRAEPPLAPSASA